MSEDLKPVHLYIKGHCTQQYGAWAYVLNVPNTDVHRTGAEAVNETTANQMEIEAAIKGFEAITRPCVVSVFTNSTYLRGGITLLLNNTHYDTFILKWLRLSDAMYPHVISVIHMPKAENNGYMRLADSMAFNLLPPELRRRFS